MSKATGSPKRKISLAQLVLFVPWVALVIDAWGPIRDNSFLWHIRAGELQARSGAVLTEDPFSFTALAEPWITQSWLAEILYWWGESTSGLGFVGPMMLLASSITVLGVALLVYRRSNSVLATSIILILATIIMLRFIVPRPVLFSYPLLVLVMLAWDRPQVRWSMPFLFWIWASVHGSFVIGLAYVGLMILARREWRWLSFLAVSGAVTLVTAHGLGIVTMLLDFGQARPYLRLIGEWRAPEIISVALSPLLVAIVLLILGGILGRLALGDLWVVGAFLALSLSAERAVATGFLALTPVLGDSLRGLRTRFGTGFSPKVAGPVVVLVLVLPFAFIRASAIDEEAFPVDAATTLTDVPTFHDDYAGGYLIWRYGTERAVYIDDRAELYRDHLVEFSDVQAGREDWKPVFERYGIQQVLLRSDRPLVVLLRKDGWMVRHEDDQYIVLTQ